MELKPGYKQTEVGVIPEDWEVQPLLSAVRIACGQVSPRIEPYKSMILVAPDHIESSTGRLLSRVTAADQGAISGKYLFGPGDILYSKIRPYLRKATIAHFSGLCSADMYPLAPAKGVSSGYMLAVILGHRFTRYAESVSVRSGMPKINREELSSFSIPIPPGPEQIRIAETLGDVDQLLDLLEGLIAKKRNIKQAAMQELLTGKRRLKGFGPTRSFKRYEYGLIPEDWNTELLRKISTMSGRIGWQGLKQEEFTDNPEDPFLITGMNFKEGKIDWSSVYHIPDKRYLEAPPIQLKPKDILMTKDGTIGKLLYVEAIPHPGKASLNSHLLVLRPVANMYAPEFLYYQLASPYFASHIEINKSGSTFFGLTQAAAGKYPVVLPSIDEQMAIGRALLSIDDAIDQLQHRLEKTQLLKAGILHELLTGRTRLK